VCPGPPSIKQTYYPHTTDPPYHRYIYWAFKALYQTHLDGPVIPNPTLVDQYTPLIITVNADMHRLPQQARWSHYNLRFLYTSLIIKGPNPQNIFTCTQEIHTTKSCICTKTTSVKLYTIKEIYEKLMHLRGTVKINNPLGVHAYKTCTQPHLVVHQVFI